MPRKKNSAGGDPNREFVLDPDAELALALQRAELAAASSSRAAASEWEVVSGKGALPSVKKQQKKATAKTGARK